MKISGNIEILNNLWYNAINSINLNLAGGIFMERYPITEKDRQLIEIGLQVLANNFDDGIYNHTVGCAVLCKNGNIYQGVNCDGIHGSCAEYITIGMAI